jgi:hypothetical protein
MLHQSPKPNGLQGKKKLGHNKHKAQNNYHETWTPQNPTRIIIFSNFINNNAICGEAITIL